MATFRAIYEFDLRDLNFSDIRDASYSAGLAEDANNQLFGKTYSDAYAYYWDAPWSEIHAMGYMGRDMSINALGELITGRIQVIADTISVAGTLLDNWYVVGTDIAARDLTVAGRTRSTADDKRVLADIFRGNDRFQLSQGDDYIDGHAGNDVIRGGVGHDSLIGGAGNDRLLGQGGDDRLSLDFGADTLDGGAGRDWVVASGAGRITVDLARKGAQNTGYGQDVLVRVENVQAGRGNDRISGSDSANELLGSGGNDRLIGRGGNDILRGGRGDDVLDGGRGRDVMQGGMGADLFLFRGLDDVSASGGTADRITDFTQGQDRIHLSAIDARDNTPGNNAFIFAGEVAAPAVAEGQVVFRQFDFADDSRDFTTVLFGTDADTAAEGLIRLSGLIDLTATDFVL